MPKTEKLLLLLVTVMCSGLIAAGCGDDDEESSGGGGDTTAADTKEATTKDSGGSSGGSTDAATKQAVDACKKSIAAAPNLKADTKKDLDKVCEEIASGDAEAAADATRKVCVGIAEDTIPAGAARDQAVSACKQATTTP